MNYHIVKEGEWIEVQNKKTHRIKCCDCGLVHDYKFRVVGRKIQFQPIRNERATAAARRGDYPAKMPDLKEE